MLRHSRRVDVALVFLVCVLAFVNARIFATAQIDDAYITFRHADNLARGLGPTYNALEHVEGSSSFFFVVALAVLLRFGAEPLAAARVLGTASFLGLTALTYVAVRSTAKHVPRALATGAALVVASSTPLAFYAMSGLETDVYAFLLMVTLSLLVAPPPVPRMAWGVAGALAATARPEGCLFFALLFVLFLAHALQARRPVLREAGQVACAFAAIFGALTIFRIAYYHAWFPNTVRAKDGSSERFHGLGLGAALEMLTSGQGADMIAAYARHLGITAIVSLVGLRLRRTRFATTAALTVASACALVVVWSDGDWMPYERLMTPAMAPMALAISLGLDALLDALPSRLRAQPAALAIVAVGLGVPAWGSFYESDYQFPFERTARYLRWLGAKLGAEARDGDLLATDIGGRVPYYSRLPTIETFGLCDPYIAAHGKNWARMGKTDTAYVVGRNPSFYLFNGSTGARDLYRDPAFAAHRGDYLVVQTAEYMKGFGKMLLVRRDRAGLDHLAAALDAKLVELEPELARLHVL